MNTRKDLIRDLKRADILLMANNTLFARWIKALTKSIYSHVEIYIGAGECVGATNKGGKGVRIRTIQQNMRRFYRIDICRYPYLYENKTEIVCQEAMNHIGEKYNYLMLFWFPLMWLFPDKWKNPFVRKEAKVCSELVSRVYKNAGIDLVPDKVEGQESPGDIAKSLKLKFIGAYIEGHKTKHRKNKQ